MNHSKTEDLSEPDFDAFWERQYGRPLLADEKLEIKTSLLGFGKALIRVDLCQKELALKKELQRNQALQERYR